MKKHHTKLRQTKFWERARAICNLHPVTTLHSRYNFVLQLYENAHVSSESEPRNFFVYIIIVCLCTVGVILTLFAQTSVCKSSILFFIHFFIKSWQGEFVHNQEFLFSVITSSNFMAFIFDPGLILLGEIRCQSLLVVKSDMFKDCKALQKKKTFATQMRSTRSAPRLLRMARVLRFFQTGTFHSQELSSCVNFKILQLW